MDGSKRLFSLEPSLHVVLIRYDGGSMSRLLPKGRLEPLSYFYLTTGRSSNSNESYESPEQDRRAKKQRVWLSEARRIHRDDRHAYAGGERPGGIQSPVDR